MLLCQPMSTPYTSAYKVSRYRPVFNPLYSAGTEASGLNGSETFMPFQTEHIAPCAALYVDVFANKYRPLTRPAARAFLSRLLSDADMQGFVLVDGLCQPVAFAIGSRLCTAADGCTDTLAHFDLREFCVRGDLQGHGCGARLLAHIERELHTTHIAFSASHSSSRVGKLAHML